MPDVGQSSETSVLTEELLESLLVELGASAGVKLEATDRTALTLREALERVLWKSTTPLTLLGRPRDYQQKDDQFGHILSMRAELQILQTLVFEIGARSGIPKDELNKLVTNVKGTF